MLAGKRGLETLICRLNRCFGFKMYWLRVTGHEVKESVKGLVGDRRVGNGDGSGVIDG